MQGENSEALVKQMVVNSPQHRRLRAKLQARFEKYMNGIMEGMELSRDLERLTQFYHELVGLDEPVDSAIDTFLAALEGI